MASMASLTSPTTSHGILAHLPLLCSLLLLLPQVLLLLILLGYMQGNSLFLKLIAIPFIIGLNSKKTSTLHFLFVKFYKKFPIGCIIEKK